MIYLFPLHLPITIYKNPSQKPPELLHPRPIPQHLRRHIPNIQHPPQPPIPPPIIHHHIQTQQPRYQRSRSTKRSGRRERGQVSRRGVREEDVGGDEAHDVGEGHAHRGHGYAAAFVGDVVLGALV